MCWCQVGAWSGVKQRMRAVSRYMCRKVICAQVLNVGARPSSRGVNTFVSHVWKAMPYSSPGDKQAREEGCTGIPPSLAHAEILAVLGLGRLGSLLFALRDGVLGWPGAFFDQLLAGAVRDVCFRDAAGSFSEPLRDHGGWARFWRGFGLCLALGILRGCRPLGWFKWNGDCCVFNGRVMCGAASGRGESAICYEWLHT